MQLPDEQNSKRQVSDENQEKMEKIFLEKPDWKKKEKHHQTGKTKDSSLVSVYLLITKVSIDGPTIPKTKAVVGCAGSNGCHETDGCCGCPGL